MQKANAAPTSLEALAGSTNKFYLAAWRWHFYAGVYVVPFLFVLALTGLVMLYQPQIENVQYHDRLYVMPSGQPTPAQVQLQAVRDAYPDATVSEYALPPAPDRSARFALTTADGQALQVFVNPYTAEVLGGLNPATTVGMIAETIHGTLLIGDTGDRLIEIAAGLGIMLLITGLYLWWPRSKAGAFRAFFPSLKSRGRALWRDLHASVGFYVSLALLFFLISGMAWTGVWGERIVQPFNSFPAASWESVPLAEETHHETLNQGGKKNVPWGLEQTQMPASGSMAGQAGIPQGTPVNLGSVVAYARDNGFTGFRVTLPEGETGVYTIAAATMSGDIKNPLDDRTLHIDRYSGKVLGDVGFAEYTLMAKGMAAGIALHMGEAGWWNVALNTLFCLSVMFIAGSGVVMWWLRRPKGVFRLAPPPMPRDMPLWQGAVVVMLLVSLAFPLTGVTLLGVLALDLLVISRIPALRRLVA